MCLAGLAALVTPVPAAAAEIEEVVVTARRREEALQDTPVAVSVFSGSVLEARQADNVAQVGEAVPNLTFHNGAPIGGGTTTGSIFIRGIGSNEVSLGTEPGVGLYVDDVYLARSVGSVLDLADIESVQVLRGPQGTLFGRNSVGGAILVRTRRPEDNLGASVRLTTGSDERAEILATVNVPVSASVRSRFALLGAHRDGFVDNLDGGDDLGGTDRFVGRGVLEWKPREDLLVTISADGTHARDSAVPSVLLGLVPTIPGTPVPSQIQAIANVNAACGGASVLGNSGNPACIDQQYIRGPFAGFGGYVSPDPIFDSQGSNRYENESRLDVWGTNVKIEWDVNADLTLKSITAWRDLDAFWPSNSDHSPNFAAETKNDFEQHQLTQELQLLGTAFDGSLDWILGGYYLDENGENLNVVHFPAVIFRSGGQFDTTAEAVFAQGTWSLLDRFELTAGLRYTHEYKRFETADFQQIIGVLLDPVRQLYLDLRSTPIPFVTGNTPALNFNELTPHVSFVWHVRQQLMTYVSYSKGYKSGGYEQRLAPGATRAPSFEPEFAEVYELGFKSTLANGRLSLNGAWFYTDYTDMQISVVDGVAPTLTNAGDSTITGIELEANWRPAEPWQATFSLGWLDAAYDRLTVRALNSGVALDGELPNTSEWQLAASLAYDIAWGDRGTLTPRLDWSWRSSYFVDGANSPLLEQDDFHLLNASLTYSPPGERWALVLSGRNLTDEAYLVAGLAQYNIGQTEGQFARPREWNLSLRLNF